MAQHETVTAAGNFLVPNATFIAELVAFLLILGLLGRYVLPPVQKAMHDRQEIIRKQLDDAEEARTKLAEAQAEYQRALTEARTQAAVIRDSARADAQRIGDDMRAQATEESARHRGPGRGAAGQPAAHHRPRAARRGRYVGGGLGDADCR